MVLEHLPDTATATSGGTSLGETHPAPSTVEELPLQEHGDEVAGALSLLEKYWGTSAWKERTSMVFDPERVTPLMQNYYETQMAADPVPGELAGKGRYRINGVEILYFSYAGRRISGSVEVAMRRGQDGRFLIDWESLVGYGEMSFKDLRAQRPSHPVLLRAYARQFEYFNFEFTNASKYFCVRLNSEDGNNAIYGYCERGTTLAQWLETELRTTGPSGCKGFTVSVSFPPNAASNQCVHLHRVIAARWLVLQD